MDAVPCTGYKRPGMLSSMPTIRFVVPIRRGVSVTDLERDREAMERDLDEFGIVAVVRPALRRWLLARGWTRQGVSVEDVHTSTTTPYRCCCKCSATDIGVKWVDGGIDKPYLACRCRKCDYRWFEGGDDIRALATDTGEASEQPTPEDDIADELDALGRPSTVEGERNFYRDAFSGAQEDRIALRAKLTAYREAVETEQAEAQHASQTRVMEDAEYASGMSRSCTAILAEFDRIDAG